MGRGLSASDAGSMSSPPAPAPTGQRVSWPLVVTLAVVALVRPLLSVTGLADDLGRPATPVLATVAITVVWVAVVVATRAAQPVLTLLLAGLTYGGLAVVGSAMLSPLLDGELRGPLAHPASIVPVLMVNVLWGALSGLVAQWLIGRRDAR
jgi:hypothetical protein